VFNHVFQKALLTNDDDLNEIMSHAEKELECGHWSVLGWWKSNCMSRDDVNLLTP
jgi:hypothetical protein